MLCSKYIEHAYLGTQSILIITLDLHQQSNHRYPQYVNYTCTSSCTLYIYNIVHVHVYTYTYEPWHTYEKCCERESYYDTGVHVNIRVDSGQTGRKQVPQPSVCGLPGEEVVGSNTCSHSRLI